MKHNQRNQDKTYRNTLLSIRNKNTWHLFTNIGNTIQSEVTHYYHVMLKKSTDQFTKNLEQIYRQSSENPPLQTENFQHQIKVNFILP